MAWMSVKAATLPIKAAQQRMEALLEKAVATTAYEIEREAKILAPVDTGALKGSVYTATHKRNDRERALAEMRRKSLGQGVAGRPIRNKAAGSAPDPGKPHGRFEAVVAVGVEYGVWVNAKNPFWTRAVWRKRKLLKKLAAEAAAKAGGSR